MRKKMSNELKDVAALKKMDLEDRFPLFVDQVVSSDEVWGLLGEGWASFFDRDQGIQAFPVWSSKELAEINAVGDWAGFEARSFTVQQFVVELAPGLVEMNYQLAVSKLPEDTGHFVRASMAVDELQKLIS